MIAAVIWLGVVVYLLHWFASGKASGFGIAIGGWQGKLGIAVLLFVIFGWIIPLAWGLRLLLKRR